MTEETNSDSETTTTTVESTDGDTIDYDTLLAGVDGARVRAEGERDAALQRAEAAEKALQESAQVARDDDPQTSQDSDTESDEQPPRHGVRARLKDAEDQRDRAMDLLTRTRQAIVDHAAALAGVDPRILTATGRNVESFLDESGMMDPVAVKEAIEAVQRELGLSRRPQPDAAFGRGGHPAVPSTMADVLRQSLRPR
ncbi:hypothetical protein IUQ79_20805 [Mycobacteroides abscessus subsp. bolletii]|uniref:hypothetical protein n=1 Tax=Mycobacteroides abscessus TaxID=36809 RepID=UPI0019D3060C|nr:hypothetical protein [Mycobacteroides abscessus]MBN7304340.1 hypothetical protein [Mycobacteroides abscessus subsp. bolletii]